MQRTSWRLSAAGPAGRRTLVARRSLPIIRRCAISWRPLGQFDVVFCRNVLIYFDQPTKAKLLDAIAQQMPADGILYLGAAETVLGITSGHWGVSTTQTAEEGALRGLAGSKVPEECRHAERVSRTPDGYRQCPAASLRCVGRRGCHDRALQHRRQSGRSRFAWDHPYPYLYRSIKAGHIVPGAPWTIIQETGTSTVIDGNWGFGYVVTDRAMRYTIDKAEQQQVAAATVYHQSHIGRLASYPLMAARDRNYLYRMIKRHGIARKE